MRPKPDATICKADLADLVAGEMVECGNVDEDRCGRIVARCHHSRPSAVQHG